MSATTEAFSQAMSNAGVEPPGEIIADGNLHRYTLSGDKARSNNGWYVLHLDGVPAARFGNWKDSGVAHKWSAKPYQSMTTTEKTAHSANMEAMKRQREEEQAKVHAECREWCAGTWAKAEDATSNHPYLERKGVHSYGLKTFKGGLMVPVKDLARTLHGVQFIQPDGSKIFKTGTDKKGRFYKIGGTKDETVIICEGYATGASLHMATTHAVIIAFDTGNLKPVAEVVRSKYPKLKIIIAADDDAFDPDGRAREPHENGGIVKATEAARAVGGLVAIPSFPMPRHKDQGTDFNDLHQLAGPDAVRLQIEAAAPVTGTPATTNDAPGNQWAEPLLFGEIETPEIRSNLIPEPLAGYCQAVSDSTQTPPGMAVMMALATVATCLQKRFEVCPYGDSYTEPVNIMPLIGSEPATRKSAVVKAMTEPLSIWETEQAERLKEETVRIRHQREILTKSIDSIKSAASKPTATDADRREALTEIKRLDDSMPAEITAPRLWTDDVTLERLQNMMADNGERISVISAEGGFFEVAAGLYSGGKSNVNIVLQGHAGEPVRVERQGRSVTMLRPALTFGLMVQPSIISDLAAGNKARFRGNGMLARMLYCLPKSNVGSRDVTKRKAIPAEIGARYKNLIFDLLAIQPLSDESGRERPRLLTLESSALKAWQKFSQYVESNQGPYGEFNSIQDWTGKLPGAALRMAGLCHVAEHGEKSTVISLATIENALDLAELLIIHAKAAFALMGSDPAIPDAKYILEWIIKNDAENFRRGDLHKSTHGKFQRVERLIMALKVLTERNIISEPQDRPTGRRPEIIYQVNPAILGGGYGVA